MSPTDLRSIRTFPSLVKYLRDELDWPIETDDFDDLTFDYRPEELGIDPKTAAKIEEIKQLRPLVSKQPWGIFFIKFEPKKLPVVVLRRILRTLIIKKRASASKSHQATWNLHDLLFISSYGESDHRDITFAHFTESEQVGDLPALRVLGWDDEDTVLHLEHAHKVLREKLRWPGDPHQAVGWGEQWSSAFTLKHREVITTSKDLAIQLAHLATAIRKRVSKVLSIETEDGPLHRLMESFKKAVIHDLYEEAFADMYAQTITYGLLSARVSRPAGLVAENITDMVPTTNPFLKDLLSTFLTVGGRKGNIDFDELGINEVVHALRDANMEAVLRDFGDKNPQEDPVIHFYELFLKEYNPKLRMQRGVFYTPRPVVSFIVRSVDEILRTEFGLEDGLADITTWGETLKRFPEIKLPKDTDPAEPFVQILDPALGTGTFLVEVIDIIHKTMTTKWQKAGESIRKQQQLWNEYVPKHLLPRLYGFELLMAPYAIAHMKIGLKLWETGYRFGSDVRAHIYLTNSLEPPSDIQKDLPDLLPALANEARAVNDIKHGKRFTVVIGNPPYSGLSANMSEGATAMVEPYKYISGKPLGEKKHWLQDDYVKFIRLGEILILQASMGILGYITNHGYLDNPTFRGLRWNLLQSFSNIFLLDLHGNSKRGERCPDGSEDNNVFDIQQGVAIGLFLCNRSVLQNVKRADFWGTRDLKYQLLHGNDYLTTVWSPINPGPEFYRFVQQNESTNEEYSKGWRLPEIMSISSAGFITARDHFVIDFEQNQLLRRIDEFADPSVKDEYIRRIYFDGCGSKKYPQGDTRGWKLGVARKKVQSDNKWRQRITECLYRPFDIRKVYWAEWMIDWPRPEITHHMLYGPNLALISARSNKSSSPDHFFCSKIISETKCGESTTQSCIFPLYLYDDDSLHRQKLEKKVTGWPNLAQAFLKELSSKLDLKQTGTHGLPQDLIPEDIFDYTYAVFYSPTYRARYAEFLKIDFPRLPLTSNLKLFRALAKLGGELVALHLMESPKLEKHITKFVGDRNPEVEKVSSSDETVWIDKAQTAGFKGVPENVWNFHVGGYQVCEKWLKDRKGRRLTEEDITHYPKIVIAINETIRLMAEIDEVIEKHGGWPGAFLTAQKG